MKDYRRLKEIVSPDTFKRWQEVDGVIYALTDLGAKVAIDDKYSGLIYKNEIFKRVYEGQRVKAFVKRVRDNGRIDLTLQTQEGKHIFFIKEQILKRLHRVSGKLSVNDKSPSGDISKEFQISKKIFKKAIGSLYKERKIKITDEGIEIAALSACRQAGSQW